VSKADGRTTEVSQPSAFAQPSYSQELFSSLSVSLSIVSCENNCCFLFLKVVSVQTIILHQY
ncbi:hypothetical protein C0J52_13975, partial [Blattella germanica]